MVAADDVSPEARPPRLTDLVGLCRRLNDAGAPYVSIGGMAIIQAGFVRATEDIDLLVESSPSVPMPFASVELLWRTKQTVRDKDRQDRLFLQALIDAERRTD